MGSGGQVWDGSVCRITAMDLILVGLYEIFSRAAVLVDMVDVSSKAKYK